jgi:ISXO2-like transposase domain
VAAVETTADGKAHRVKLRHVRRFTKKVIKAVTSRIVTKGAHVVTDGLGCFYGVADAVCTHEAIVTGAGRKAARHPAFGAFNTVLSNIKTAIAATFRSGASKHVPGRLAEFAYRFNRRYDLPAMIPRLAWIGVRTPPMPYRMP